MEYCKDCANKNCEFVEVGFALKRRHLFFCAQKISPGEGRYIRLV